MLDEILGRASGALFAAGSRLRKTKVLHPHGLVHDATLVIDGAPGAPRGLLADAAEHVGVVRLSRGGGLPRPLPDFIGLAIRLPDVHGEGRHQDLLLVSSGEGVGVHHLFRPALSITDGPYSTILPYEIGGEQYVIAARPRSATHFDLGVTPLTGRRMRRIGELRLGARRPDDENDLRFNPYNTGGGLEPATVFNRMRRWAYPMSQAGWMPSSDGSSDMSLKTSSASPSEIGGVKAA
jgi:hypothetical protein